MAMAGHGQGSVSSASAPNFTYLLRVADDQIPRIILLDRSRPSIACSTGAENLVCLSILATTGRRKAGRQEEPGHSQKPRTPQEPQEVYVGIVGMLV